MTPLADLRCARGMGRSALADSAEESVSGRGMDVSARDATAAAMSADRQAEYREYERFSCRLFRRRRLVN
jgi:hypothetical protein